MKPPVIPQEDLNAADVYAEGYKTFLTQAKTERESVDFILAEAMAKGFRELPEDENHVAVYTPGEGFFVEKHGKAVALMRIGTAPIGEGLRIVAAHIDAPRIDLKPNPLHADGEFAYFKTHYYGGIKKYQWLTIPLSLHGVVFRKDGSKVTVRLGDDPADPVFFISDVLPHLGQSQTKKNVKDAFPGEKLHVTLASRPTDVPEKADTAPNDANRENPLKSSDAAPESKNSLESPNPLEKTVLDALRDRYDIGEDDFFSAELCFTPAGAARDVGFDRSMVGGYGQDDRACAYAGLRAILDADKPTHTTVCIFADKEEIGSDGISGMQSGFFDMAIETLLTKSKTTLRRLYDRSFCLSADVCNAFDPLFADVHDKQNNARLGYGPGVFKATGHAGKAAASDASAETMSRVRMLFDSANIPRQVGEMGKVDEGGGGTVAKYLALRGIEVVDLGVPVISMHSPFEVTAKTDNYYTYRAIQAHFNS